MREGQSWHMKFAKYILISEHNLRRSTRVLNLTLYTIGKEIWTWT